MGWIVHDPITNLAYGFSMVITEALTATFSERKTQIIVAEALALVCVGVSCGHILAGRDVVWFIDNEAVASAAIRGCSSMWEVSAMLDAVVVAFAAQNSRTWYEWIDSKSNPSDCLSREGITCPVAKEICKTRLWEWPPLTAIPSAEQLRMQMEMKNSGDISERNSGR